MILFNNYSNVTSYYLVVYVLLHNDVPSFTGAKLVLVPGRPLVTNIYPNHSILMSCAATTNYGENSTVISWSVNGNTIKNGSFYDFSITSTEINEGGFKFVLSTLTDCGFIDADKIGWYSCTASNSDGNDTAYWYVSISNGVQAVVTSATNSFTVRHFGDNLTMTCLTSGIPPPKVNFTRNGKRIEESLRIIVTTVSGGFALEIHNFGPNDLGSYSCIAYNNIGSPDATKLWSVTANVEPRPSEIVLLSASAQEVMYSSSVLMNCVAYGYPFPTITFTKDGVTLENSTMVTITENFILEGGVAFTHSVLVLCDVRETEIGRYTCTAHNNQGNHTLLWSISRVIGTHVSCTYGVFTCMCILLVSLALSQLLTLSIIL